MVPGSPEWIEQRILWMLGRHRLPGLTTRLYGSENAPPEVVHAAENVGQPIAYCDGPQGCWVLLGTSAVAGMSQGSYSCVPFSEVTRVSVPDKGVPVVRPGERSRLPLLVDRERGNQCVFWFATEHERSAFWSILQRLGRSARREGGGLIS
jgi:hypothetical protein